MDEVWRIKWYNPLTQRYSTAYTEFPVDQFALLRSLGMTVFSITLVV